ncbi:MULTISPECIES: DedA family protein [Anaerolinea]|uniref:DedA family protein n=1 Tax=Anaerolinea TaxID=233189 RepID=UPI00262A48D8|nr:DedA family protein [Anaerolinea thermophila]
MDVLLELFRWFVDFVLHMDRHLPQIVNDIGIWVYAVLFLVIFVETGLVVTPFLPGDSLLFAAGAVSATTSLHPLMLWALLALAAVLGDTANYWIGHFVGPKVFTQESRWFKREYLDRTHAFYEKHGGKTIFLARFIPIIRTFAPFVAGIGRMRYGYFISYNVIGGIVWTGLFIGAGYFFGNLPIVKENFSLVILAIILISLVPAVVEYVKEKARPRPAVVKE